MLEVYIVRMILFVVSIVAVLGFIKSLSNRKKIDALPYLLIFLGFGTTLVSMYVPGGFEGMFIGGIGLIMGILAVFWVLGYIIVKKRRPK
jgi:hypothetical protein